MIDLKRIAAGATIAGALGLTAVGLGTGVANAAPPAPVTAGSQLPQGHGDYWGNGGRGDQGRGGDWHRGYYGGQGPGYGYGYGYGGPPCFVIVAGVCI
jgi:hypothetical protein